MYRWRAVTLVVAFTLVAAAQEKPNFSGTWKCDVARSVGCLDNSIAVIKHENDTLTMSMGGGKEPSTVYKVGETVTFSPAKPGAEKSAQTTARWDGNTLVTEMVTNEGDKRTATSTWRLSADGKELTIEVQRTGAKVQPHSKYVYVKTSS